MDEDKIHEKAVKMRKMTDEQLVHYVEDRVNKARSEGFNEGKLITQATIAPSQLPVEEILDKLSNVKGIGKTLLREIEPILIDIQNNN